ncbi:MAG TPA: SEC-C metal-binding domain-containing protein [Clostridia bacterium]|nr:SEC-C metal-binding domain-containing protein [Clostridia bacterium]
MPKKKQGRNAPCWCGSGKKYKNCHLGTDAVAEANRNRPSVPRGRDIFEIRDSILSPRQLRSDEVGPDRR